MKIKQTPKNQIYQFIVFKKNKTKQKQFNKNTSILYFLEAQPIHDKDNEYL